jgi:hypothetical protein
VLLERVDLADSTAVAKVLAAPIAYVLWSAACDADWKAFVARRDVTSEIVELAPVGVLDGRGTRPALIVEQCVADFSQWFALDAAELIALVLAEERGKTWRVERTTCRSSDASA